MEKTQMKETLKQAWKVILPNSEAEDSSDFFADGGDSIKAVQLVGWLAQKGVKLEMLKVFTTAVLGEMAESLEETQPMHVPAEMLTKEILRNQFGIDPSLVSKYPENKPDTQQTVPQPAAAPAGLNAWNGRFGTPSNMPNGQYCTPASMPYGQYCTPANMPYGQYCTPANMPYMSNGQYFAPINLPLSMEAMPGAVMMPMITMIPMMVMVPAMPMMSMMQTGYAPAGMAPQLGMGQLAGPNGAFRSFDPRGFMRRLAEYRTFPVQTPAEIPNVTKIEPPHTGKPVRPADEVFLDVMKGILPNYDPAVDLFEQGVSSFNLIQIVTRCAEQGYRLNLQDIIQNPDFERIVSHMVPGGSEA